MLSNRFYNIFDYFIRWILLSIKLYYQIDSLSIRSFYPLDPIIHKIIKSIRFYYPLNAIILWILLSFRFNFILDCITRWILLSIGS